MACTPVVGHESLSTCGTTLSVAGSNAAGSAKKVPKVALAKFWCANYTCAVVLQVMYAYYASSCFGLRWPKFLARNITTLQLAQMFANLALLVATFCCCGFNNHMSLWPTTVMYAVYACLFMDLYRERYNKQKDRQACDKTSIKAQQGGC